MADFIPCEIKTLPQDKIVDAAKISCMENPVNAPPAQVMAAMSALMLGPPTPEHLSVVTGKYWSAKGVKLGVSFLDNPPADLRARIIGHANAWGKTAAIEFVESAHGEVRIARTPGLGYWSYLGTDILSISSGNPTMNLDSFTMNTADSEFYRVVRHEFGHTCAFPHEHLRTEIVADLDPAKTVAYFMATQGWSERDVYYQVLTPVSERSIMGTPHADRTSIMCYQLPASITKSGNPIPGGDDINEQDYAFVGKVYPKSALPPPPPVSGWLAFLLKILDWLRTQGAAPDMIAAVEARITKEISYA